MSVVAFAIAFWLCPPSVEVAPAPEPVPSARIPTLIHPPKMVRPWLPPTVPRDPPAPNNKKDAQ